jgi:hypothetical protein
VDKHAAQVDVAAFADAVQPGLAPGGVLFGDEAEPGGKLPSFVSRLFDER